MGVYQSKYTGEEIDNLLDKVAGSSSSGYKEVELLSKPVSYSITSTNGWTVLGSDIVLSESITKFDQLVFCIELEGSSSTSRQHMRTNTVLVSNISFNNSDTMTSTGEHFLLDFGSSTYHGSLGGWFKTDTIYRAYQIACVSSNTNFKCRISSIKGIKY